MIIHIVALALGTSDSTASVIIVTFGSIVVALFTLIGIVIKNGKDVRIVRNRITSNIEDKRHEQNTKKFISIEKGQAEQRRAIIRIEDKLGIEHTIVPNRKKTTK